MWTKEESGYLETPDGTRCGTCKFKILPEGCEMVEGHINMETGCCIAWTPDEETEEITATEAKYNPLFKFYGRVDLD